jgi:hypothetical protein
VTNVGDDIVTYSGFYIHDWTLLHSKSQYTTVKHSQQLLRTHVHVRPIRSRNTHSYRILPTGPLVAIFQHSLQFLQSESFQTQVGTTHRRAIGHLAHHNGTSAHHYPAISQPRRSNVFTVHRIDSRASLTVSPTQLPSNDSQTTMSRALQTLSHNCPKNLSLMYHTAVSIVMFLFKLLCDCNKSIVAYVSIVMQ